MTLLDEVLAATPKRGPACTVCRWLETVPDPEEWRAILANRDLSSSAIYAVAVRRGYIGASTDAGIERHRTRGHR